MDLLLAWEQVFRFVIGQVDFEFIEDVALKPLMEMIGRKNTVPRRRQGNRLLTSLAHAWGEEGFEKAKIVLHALMSIC